MAASTKKTKVEPFIVIDKGLRILLTPCEGWYCVQGLDIRGLNTQGRTVEEAIYMAHDAAKALEEARASMAKETAKRAKQLEQEIKRSTPMRTPRRRQPVGAK